MFRRSFFLLVLVLVACKSLEQQVIVSTEARPIIAILPSPTEAASYTPLPTETPTVTPSPTLTSTPTIAITPTLVAATFEIGYTFTAETRGAVTLRATTGTINYLVSGKNADEITWQMSILGPRDEIGNFVWFGLTDPNYDWDYACTCTESGCEPPTVTINLFVRYLIPHWSEDGMEHDPLAAYWSYFEGALLAHEKGHGEIAMTCGWQFGEAINNLPPASTCEAFDASVRGTVDAVYQSCRLLHRAYDDQTGHGASQGVAWPPTMPTSSP